VTPEILAARWRKETARYLIELAGMIATGGTMFGAPDETEVSTPRAILVAIVGNEGVIVTSKAVRTRDDVRGIERAIRDAYDPESAARRREWEKAEAVKLAAYEARAFPCELGGCRERFESERGRAQHYAAARRRAKRYGNDWCHGETDELLAPAPRPAPKLGLVDRSAP
jgi:hypothetical protein